MKTDPDKIAYKGLSLSTCCPACGANAVVVKSGDNENLPALLAEYVCGTIINSEIVEGVEKPVVSINAGCPVVVTRALGLPW